MIEKAGKSLTNFRFRTVIPVRFRDIDALGHVNNSVYLTYFEIARTDYFGAVLGRAHNLDDISIVIAESHCRYRSPILYGEPLVAEIGIGVLRSRSFEMLYRLRAGDDGRLAAEGSTVQVAVNPETKRVTTLSPNFITTVRAFEDREDAVAVD